MINPELEQPIPKIHGEEDIPTEGSRLREEARLGQINQPLTRSSVQTNPSSSGGVQILQSTEAHYRIVGEPVVISSIPLSQLGTTVQPGQINQTVSSGVQQGGVPLQTGVPIASNTITTTSGTYQRELPRDIPITQSTTYQPGTLQGATTTYIREERISQTGMPVQSVGQSTINQPVIEGVSEIQQSDEHLRDSMTLGRQSEINQQAQLSSMRYQSHQNFENWEANRNLFVTDRQNIIDDLLAGMEKKLDWLDLGVQKVILFFKERESQELEYSRTVKHGLTQLGEHFAMNDNPEAISDFSRGMKESDAFHAQDQKNSIIMGNFIKKDILDWILLPSEKEYKIQANSLRSPLHTLKKKLDSNAAKRGELYNKYFKLYDNLLKHPTKPSPKENSIFKRQLKYSLAAREELRMLRLYGEQALMVISEFTRLATVRMSEIQRSFSLYLQKYTELHKNSATTPEPILELIERSNGPEAIQRLFSPRSLLTPANYDFLRKQLGRDDITYADLTPYLVNFPESIDPARSSFVLKEWDAVKEGGFLKKPRAVSIVATTGNSLLIIEKKHVEQEVGKVKDPYLMRYTKVENFEEGVDGTTMKVVERVPGTLFTHTHTTKLKFETPEEAQSFVTFMQTHNTNTQSQMIGDV